MQIEPVCTMSGGQTAASGAAGERDAASTSRSGSAPQAHKMRTQSPSPRIAERGIAAHGPVRNLLNFLDSCFRFHPLGSVVLCVPFMRTIGHWIGGKPWEPRSERHGDVFNPATGDKTGEVAFASIAEVDA